MITLQLMQERSGTFLGYPESMDFDYKPLQRFTAFNIDNPGDPYSELLYAVNSTSFEREVIDYFAQLYHLPADQAWGYVTSSGSEGNLYGIYLGREAYPGAVLYYSTHAHYSVAKAGRLLMMPKQIVPSQANGEFDYAALEKAIAANRNKPVVINATIGTTVTGATDDIDKIIAILKRQHITKFYIHCDAALSGMVLPFVAGAPQITFSKPIGSVSVSGHKYIGAPYPCGIVVARRKNVERIQTKVEYIGAIDATIGGSRNGQAPLYLWYAIKTRGARGGFAKEVATCISNAKYLYDQLKQMGVPCFMNDYSITVVFDEPSEALVRRWSLARQGGRAHVVVMPHATRTKIDAFLAELRAELEAKPTFGYA